jgi:hypothetical protein
MCMCVCECVCMCACVCVCVCVRGCLSILCRPVCVSVFTCSGTNCLVSLCMCLDGNRRQNSSECIIRSVAMYIFYALKEREVKLANLDN